MRNETIYVLIQAAMVAFVATLFVLALYLIFRAVFAFLRWQERRFADQLEADFRAFVMVEEAKRQFRRDAELERSVCALEVQWGVRRG
ncbi:hypothetical protein ISN35_15390 [Xanthomonas translucens pv. undulosa]|uniref:hypothetical protein n=1 Tax=Xanthomonas campestris pv. translucens TaxID=343 RepID=UPI0019D545D7|nr:hypothetical protein [Xanthomonas translucens]QSQ40405.1 hypothetical protein ISN33_12045 [Xanthomonas translucens pv. translucens]QSQ48398.1 hypothetical protein ISN35_15390 [Xanthomonas translucens pv. undulosa]